MVAAGFVGERSGFVKKEGKRGKGKKRREGRRREKDRAGLVVQYEKLFQEFE